MAAEGSTSRSTLVDRLLKRVQQSARGGSDGVVITSYSLESDEIATLLEHEEWGLNADVRNWQAVLPSEPKRIFETGSEGHPQAVILHEGRTTALPSPVPLAVQHRDEWKMSWLVEVRVDGWNGVRHPTLAAGLLHGPNLSGLQRPTVRGVAYVATGMLVRGGSPLTSSVVRPRLCPRDLLTQVQMVCRAAGWRAERSDKGAYAKRATDIFGGLQQLCHALTRSELQILFRAYLSGKREEGALGRWVERRRVLTLEDIRELVGAVEAETVVDDLRRREALQLGAILKCRGCRQESWYDIEAFGRSFVCSRCRLSQYADSFSWLGVEPRWSYRLDEALLQFLVHDGDLAVMVAGGIAEAAHETVDVAFELDIWSPATTAETSRDDVDEKSEIDIVVSEGARLWVGEASTSERLEPGDNAERVRLDRLQEIARVLGARHVVLANNGSWARRTRNAAKQRFRGPWPLVHIREDVPMMPRPSRLLHDDSAQA